MVHGHDAELRGSGLGQVPRNLAHLPTVLKLGLCQRLIHQTEPRVDSGCGRWGSWKLVRSTPCGARTHRKTEQAVGPAV